MWRRVIVSEGGAATDILRTLPSVEVDIDGNLSLRGSGNVTVLIDGKPSALTGAGRSAILAANPREAPSNPSRSLPIPLPATIPDGMSGIINIITKKNKSAGLNGNLTHWNRQQSEIQFEFEPRVPHQKIQRLRNLQLSIGGPLGTRIQRQRHARGYRFAHPDHRQHRHAASPWTIWRD
jgi:hypothetical protein